MIRLVIADDHAIVRAGIRAVLEAEGDLVIAAEAADGRAALEAAAQHKPDLLLLDLTMPLANGLDTIGRVRAASRRTRVLVLSMHVAPELVRGALRAGAHGYLVKGAGLDDLILAVRAVAAGRAFWDPQVASLVEEGAPDLAPADDLERLTPREREVLQLVAEGHTNREIGQQLGVAPKTIDVHRTSLMRKLDLHSAQALTRFAVRRGLVSSE